MTIITTENSFSGTITFVTEHDRNELISVLNRKFLFVEKRFKMFGCNVILSKDEFEEV